MAKKMSEFDPAGTLTSDDLFALLQAGAEPDTFVNVVATLGELAAFLALASSVPPVATIATAAHNLVAADVGRYNRTTYAGAAAVTVQPDATEAMPDNAEIHLRAVGGALTITEGAGVTVNEPAGGTLVVPVGGTVTLKRVAADAWDLIGVTEAAP